MPPGGYPLIQRKTPPSYIPSVVASQLQATQGIGFPVLYPDCATLKKGGDGAMERGVEDGHNIYIYL